ncbi:Hypothetical predicted protein [Mytilus galloprovincialis]|uniref:Uncharacterized protein n=2 Tax=Mytilus galloprovincialis TaxID=29158 RepID=A0A8B6BVC2_MYTGA|nr:Hypothetical predicted protein [Mytilus galloprovincialis]
MAVPQDSTLVVAIDIGTTYSGYAFSFGHQYKSKPLNITSHSWPDGPSYKTPTCVLLTSEKKFHSFGREAENKYISLAENEEHEDWYFVTRFKMLLMEKEELDEQTLVEDMDKKPISALLVFTEAIKYLKNHLLNDLKKRNLDVPDNQIKWVLTVPAIWSDPAKQFMRTAAEQADIPHSSLTLAYEPEAAALYCRLLPIDTMKVAGGTNYLSCFEPGKKIIIVDLGGGTADISINEVTKEHNLKTIDRASGGDWGGTNIDKKYLKFLGEVLGNNIMEEIKRDYRSDLLEIQQDFEEQKRKVTPDRDHDVVIRMPGGVMEIIRNKKQKLADIVESSQHSGTVSVKENQRDRLHIKARIFISFFKETTQHIISHLQQVLDSRHLGHIPPAMVMVGGFSESVIVTDAIRNHESFENIKVIIPTEARLAVLKGAVLFGHNPTVVISRMAKYSYGIRSYRTFKKGDPDSKRLKEEGKEWCRDYFKKLFTINQEVTVGERSAVTIKDSYKDKNRQAKRTMKHTLDLYFTTEKDPNFIDEKGCMKLGQVQIPPPDGKEWPMEWTGDFELEIGGTEIIGRFKDRISGKTVIASFNAFGVPFHYNTPKAM